jgi:hypothetical protein
MTVLRATITWTGFSGAPGYTNLHFFSEGVPTPTAMDGIGTKIRTWINSMVGLLPIGVTATFPNQLEEYDESDGELVGVHAIAQGAQVIGTGAGNYSSATGACINWTTNTLHNGRRVRGRTFIVPLLPSAAFQSNGTLLDTARTSLVSNSQIFIDSAAGYPLCVWSRPRTLPTPSAGNAALVLSATVNDLTAVLRSRRD